MTVTDRRLHTAFRVDPRVGQCPVLEAGPTAHECEDHEHKTAPPREGAVGGLNAGHYG